MYETDTNKISFTSILKVTAIYLFLSFSGCFMVLFRKAFFQSAGYKFLIWNLFLAWIPLIISLLISFIYIYMSKGILRAAIMLFLGIGWIAFYPNSPYIVTDFIHLSGIQYYFNDIGYKMSFVIWYDFIMIALFILTGFLIGYISLHIIQRLLVDRFNKIVGWIFVCISLFISSYGIYLGRFIRWNSWDIVFKPMILVKGILTSSKHYSAEFTVSFGLFLLLIYFALYSLTKLDQ